MRPDYCVAFGPSLDWTDLCWVWSENDYSLFSLFFWRNKQHLLEIHACSMLHWTRVFKTNVHIWGSSCLQEQQRKSGQIRHELWTLINDKLPHPAEETQPPFSLFSPAALLSKSFSCFFVSFFHQPMSFFFVLMFIDPWPQHKYCGRATEGWRRERTQDRDGRELLTAWIWRVLGFTTGAQPAISSMAKPEEDQPSLVLCSRRITAPTSVSSLRRPDVCSCGLQSPGPIWLCLYMQFPGFRNEDNTTSDSKKNYSLGLSESASVVAANL